jgi:twitching motility protein PilT
VFLDASGVGAAFRIIPARIRTIDELPAPESVAGLTHCGSGLVLVTGPTGCGKSTTLASIIDLIDTEQSARIITIEDPIEYIFKGRNCLISQREIGTHSHTFANALRACLREDPNVILVGEMRDLDTIETAILAAETGHLVFSTLHTLDSPESINRIISVFPPHHQRQVRLQLSSILKSVVSMRLIPRVDGTGRVPAVEVMIATPYIAECIQDKEKTGLIRDAIATGVSQYGMQTFDQSIYQLYRDGYISFEQGLRYSSNPDHFKLKVMGIQSTLDIALEAMESGMTPIERKPQPAIVPIGEEES